MSYDIKQVIVVRKDLNMRKGKMCAQVAHASMKVFFDRIQLGPPEDNCYFTNEMKNWMEGSFAKIVVSVNSESELFILRDQVEKAGIVHALILDNGNTEFKQKCRTCDGDGKIQGEYSTMPSDWVDCPDCNGTGKINKPTYTCLAIGPDKTEVIDVFTRELLLI